MNRRDAETPREDEITGEIIGVQLLTYLILNHRQIGLLLNFNVPVLKDRIKRIVNHYRPSSASPRLCGSYSTRTSWLARFRTALRKWVLAFVRSMPDH
jgi:hypothetical protein